MADPAAIVGAIAACGAAGLSGATLWVSSRREERKWLREVVLEALVAFLDASFVRLTQSALEAKRRGDDISDYVTTVLAQREKQIGVLARLRLLAPNQVVAAALDLYEADHDTQDNLIKGTTPPDEAQWRQFENVQNNARTNLINASRHTLGLGDGLPADTYDFNRR